jgi:hypothetical protein
LKWISAILHVLIANLVPLWGFTQASWSAGTTMALYWVQTLIGIPLVAILIVFHRRLTRKQGHYAGTTTIRDSTGSTTVRRSTFLETFLWMSVPFTLAHGVFLAALLGFIWKSSESAIDPADLRTGVIATLNVMALGFLFDFIGLARRPFSWIELRAGSVLQRTLVIHLAIIFGMGLAALTGRDAAAFFGVFLALKLLMDLLAEMPAWDPREPPAWMTRLMNKMGEKGKGDFREEYVKERAERLRKAGLAEKPMDEAELVAFRR